MENMEFYNKYRAVPENALKKFDNGKFKGEDINTMWRIKCLTETFGPCGIGWYFDYDKDDLWVQETPNKEQFAFAKIRLYIKADGEWSKPIVGTGGNKLTRVTKNGDMSTSDEAFKMAVTDAFGVCCRSLGIGADVYWENDKTKYTQYQNTTDGLSQELLEVADSYGISLDKLAVYYRKNKSDLTEDDVLNAIEMKRQYDAQQNARGAQQ